MLYFDCFSGISGDMVLGAFLDAGLPLDDLRRALGSLALSGYEIGAERVLRAGVSATRFIVNEHPACLRSTRLTRISTTVIRMITLRRQFESTLQRLSQSTLERQSPSTFGCCTHPGASVPQHPEPSHQHHEVSDQHLGASVAEHPAASAQHLGGRTSTPERQSPTPTLTAAFRRSSG